MLTAEQRALRRDRVGASEVAAILDQYRKEGAPRLDPHKTSLDVFMQKVLPEEPPPEDFQLWGLDVEPAIIVNRARTAGYRLRPSPDGGRLWPSILHPKLPLITTPDHLADDPSGPSLLALQAKNDQGWGELVWGQPGTDEVPPGYFCQVTVEIGVLRANNFDVDRDELVVSRRGAPPVAYPVRFDPELYGTMCEWVQKWVRDHLIPGKPPPGPTKVEAEYVRRLYPKQEVQVIEPTPHLEALVQCVRTLRATRKALKEELIAAETALKNAIGEAEGIDGLCTWKWQRGYSYKATRQPGRVLRLVGEKEENGDG